MTATRARSRRAPVKRARSRQEVLTAVGGAVAVVVGTALAIWLLRPGSALVPGSGGLASRQPRATWLVVVAVLVLVAGIVYVIRTPRWRKRMRTVLISFGLAVLVVSVIMALTWPGGLLRTYSTPEVVPEVSVPSVPPPGPDSTVPGQATAPVGTTTPAPTTAAPPTGG